MAVKQVGGDHYESRYQHWDFVEDNMIGYLEGCATKYLTRWKQKDGLKDLKKARTYVLKIIEKQQLHGRSNRSVMLMCSFSRFCTENCISDPLEITACYLLGSWSSEQNLHDAVSIITEMIEREDVEPVPVAEIPEPPPEPVSHLSTISTVQPFTSDILF